MSVLGVSNGRHHISSYEDYDMIMGQVVGKLKTLESPVWMDVEYDVGDENDDLDYAIGADGVVRAYYLGGRDVKVLQMINIRKPGVTHRSFSTNTENPEFWTQALVAIRFTRLDLMGGTIGVDGKIIDADFNRVIGSFHMNITRGSMYHLMSGLAWTFDAVVAGAATVISTAGSGLEAVGSGLGAAGSAVGSGLGAAGGAVGRGLGTGIEVVGDGLGAAGGAVGRGIGSAIGGATNLVGDVAYNMAMNAFYQSGYIQAAATIAVVLVLIDLKKNKII